MRFIARDATRFGAASDDVIDYVSWRDAYRVLARINRVKLFIYSDDQETARKVVDET